VLNGWLLYLLDEIQKDRYVACRPASVRRHASPSSRSRKTIVCPIIDVLTYDALQLLHGATDIFGTFSWKMIFRWSKIQGLSVDNQATPVR
jgi:hypothetical protein